ncbi:hypothetical protein OESDEN_03242 [Oesophagostomum dentatum]|uniref:Uncharacterized protein n=1 Tax=Oesophagostomum dentatum TaxID=61180 RepID=A0A0B1TL14_OESDE|nr:hypothetical protein OESDEN_03242 [Oesophagostomum dentatum]
MDNSVTRTDSPVLIVPELREVVELENIQRNIVASEPGNGGKEVSSPPSTTSAEVLRIVTAIEPETTTTVATALESTEISSTTEEATTTRAAESTESAETYSTTDSGESKSETTSTTVSAEVTEDLETSTDASTSSETTEAGPIPAEDEREEQTASTSTTSATPVSTVNRRRPMVHHRFGKNWRNMNSEEDSSPAVFTTKVDATASIRPDTSTGENLVVVKMMREGQLSWPGRFFVLFIAIIMVLLTIPTPMLITAGTVCYMRSYHPMDRTTFSDKVGQICVVLATVLLFFIPCICLYLDALLAYIHIYFALCPEIQAMQQITVQSLNEPPPVDRIIRSISGAQLCQRNPEMHSIRDIWLACFAFVLFSLPTVFALFKLSKYYLRMKTEYYWNAGDGYGVIRPKVATTNDVIYGNIYGTLQVQRKRPVSKPPPRPEPAAYGVYIEQPVYGAFK